MAPSGTFDNDYGRRPVSFADLARTARQPRPAPRADLFQFWWTPEFVFDDTHLHDIALIGESIEATSFAHAQLTNVAFDRCAFHGVVFKNASLERVVFNLLGQGDTDALSDRISLQGAQLTEVSWYIDRGIEVYFTSATVAMSDIAGDITHAGFTDVTIRNSRLQLDFDTQGGAPRAEYLTSQEPVHFDGACIRNSGLYLSGHHLTFDLAELAYVDMEYRQGNAGGSRGLRCWEASWVHAVLHQVNLASATMEFADFTGASLSNVQFDFAAPMSLAPNTQRRPWNFTASRLQDVSFRGATLLRADFTDATLIDVDLYGADLTGALITPEQLIGCTNWEYAHLDASLRIAADALTRGRPAPGVEGPSLR